jgi:hypothetical protein
VSASIQKRKSILAAWVCLVAAVVLYVPLGAAAWAAYSMACCTGDHCPIAQHHHQKKQASPHSGMDCGHDMDQMMECSMSCCPSSEKPLVAAVAFVLPDAQLASAAMAVTDFDESLQSLEILRSIRPVAPPPRFAHL